MELLILTKSYKPNETGIFRAAFSTCFLSQGEKVKTKPGLHM